MIRYKLKRLLSFTTVILVIYFILLSNDTNEKLCLSNLPGFKQDHNISKTTVDLKWAGMFLFQLFYNVHNL